MVGLKLNEYYKPTVQDGILLQKYMTIDKPGKEICALPTQISGRGVYEPPSWEFCLTLWLVIEKGQKEWIEPDILISTYRDLFRSIDDAVCDEINLRARGEWWFHARIQVYCFLDLLTYFLYFTMYYCTMYDDSFTFLFLFLFFTRPAFPSRNNNVSFPLAPKSKEK